jgi:hypothetical protein
VRGMSLPLGLIKVSIISIEKEATGSLGGLIIADLGSVTLVACFCLRAGRAEARE